MVIDCETCIARPRACGDCVVTHLLTVGDVRGQPRDPGGDGWGRLSLDEPEVVAVATLAAAGLVPPLRLVPSHPPNGGASSPRLSQFVTHRDDTPMRAIG